MKEDIETFTLTAVDTLAHLERGPQFLAKDVVLDRGVRECSRCDALLPIRGGRITWRRTTEAPAGILLRGWLVVDWSRWQELEYLCPRCMPPIAHDTRRHLTRLRKTPTPPPSYPKAVEVDDDTHASLVKLAKALGCTVERANARAVEWYARSRL
jgi:hypothetical protein